MHDNTTRTSILKLIIDLIKVDNKIHRDEIKWLQSLTRQYKFTPENYQTAHTLSFHEAIEHLKKQDPSERQKIISLIEQIASIDNNIDPSEQIILSTIRLALQENTSKRTRILSVNAGKFDRYDKQLIYLEQHTNTPLNQSIEQNLPLLHRQLKNIGIDFFYFPHIIKQYIQAQPFITNITELLFPHFSPDKTGTTADRILQYDTSDFSAFIHQNMGENTPPFPFDTFYLLKIQDSTATNRTTTDFLCFQSSQNPVKDIQTLIESMLLETPSDTIPYEGCYRTFFEMLSEKSKTNYNLLLENDRFYLSGKCKIPLTIQGAERKTLFTLFLLHGENGISNKDFVKAAPDTPLGQEIITLYKYFANEKSIEKTDSALAENKEPDVILNLKNPGKRTSHIGFIKKAFTQITLLKDPQIYYPQNIKGQYSYKITLPENMKWAKLANDTPAQQLSLLFFK